jgi:hypothetical protein
MWDGKSYDRIRDLRFSIGQDENYLANGPLGPIQKKRLAEKIKIQREELKILNKEKREKKKLQNNK